MTLKMILNQSSTDVYSQQLIPTKLKMSISKDF